MQLANTPVLVSVLALSLGACAGEPETDWTPRPDDPELIRAMMVAEPFAFIASNAEGTGSIGTAVGELVGDEDTPSIRADLPLPILGGHARLRATADELVVVESLQIDLADVEVDATTLPPRGISLTGLSISLATPVVIQPLVEDDQVSGDVHLDLVAEWAVDLGEGRSHPLNPVRLQDVVATVQVERNLLGEMKIHVLLAREGPFWSWLDRLQLSDLSMSLVGNIDVVSPSS